MAHNTAQELADGTGYCYLEAPAGFGKTETIALALLACKGRQLVLTHTHAGVDSLKKRLKAREIPLSKFRVETIDAFCMRYARGYPGSSGFVDLNPDDPAIWELAKAGALKVVAVTALQDMIATAFSGVIVDEYQDCSKLQHAIIKTLSGTLPLRVLGDDLQSLFTWEGQDPISWDGNILSEGFVALSPLTEARRWMQPGASKELGDWITKSRECLRLGEAPIYEEPVYLIETNQADLNQSLLKAVNKVKKAAKTSETIVILHDRYRNALKTDPMPHLRTRDPFAAVLSGHGFSVMMEIEGKLLRNWCIELEGTSGLSLALNLLFFADECCSKCTQELKPLVKGMQSGSVRSVRSKAAAELLQWLKEREDTFALADGEEWLKLVGRFATRRMHHRELFSGMCACIRRVCDGKSSTLSEAARAVREQQAHAGRRVEYRFLSRTLLVKGLQYDHVIVVCPESMNNCNQYVAFSRAVKSLTVVTTNKSGIKRSRPANDKVVSNPSRKNPKPKPKPQPQLFEP